MTIDTAGKPSYRKYALTFIQRGLKEYRLGDYSVAADSFHKATRLDQNNPISWHEHARSMFWLERHDVALKSIEKALALDPNYYKAHRTRGCIMLMKCDFKEAITSIDRCLTLITELHETSPHDFPATSRSDYKQAQELRSCFLQNWENYGRQNKSIQNDLITYLALLPKQKTWVERSSAQIAAYEGPTKS